MSLSLDRSLLKPVATVVAIVLSLFQIYFTGGFGVTDAHILRGTHLTLIMILVLLLVPSRKLAPGEKEGWFPILIDLALIALAIAINVYVFQEADNISRRLKYVEDVTNLDLFYGTGLVLLVLEATRRTSGWPLVIVSGSFLAYAMFGEYMPGGLAHNGIEYDRLIEQLFLLTDGIYGVPLGAAAGMIFAFVMFGAFLESSKMSSLFMDLACLLTRKSAGGPAKVSIFASALFGTISGSAAANVYGTGTFTIPLMKKVGYTPHFAGAVEAVASTGGQMMPPIMGAAAFIMADVIGVSYLTIAKAALIPSVLYYLTLLAIIHLEAVSKNMGTLPPELVPSAASVLRRLYYLFPLVFLITILLMGRSVIACAYYGTVCIVILSMIRSETRFTFKRLCGALELSAKNAMMVSSCCACAGIIIGVLNLTGTGLKFASGIIALSGGILPIALILTMGSSLILGMGLPTAAAYLICAAVIVPALTGLGVPALTGHLFIFYFACLSAITPPVALAAFTAASLGKTKPMGVALTAVRLGIVAFIVPFMFVYAPSLLWQGSLPEILGTLATSLCGVFFLGSALQGAFRDRVLNMGQRGLFLLGSLALIQPGLVTDLIGVGLVACALLWQWLGSRRG